MINPITPSVITPLFPRISTCYLAAIAAAFFLALSSLEAQVNTEFQITKIEPSMPTTPAVSSDAPLLSSGMAKKWMAITVSFVWKPRLTTDKFADDVTVNYYVLLANKSAAFPMGTLLNGQVTHCSIPANSQSELRSVMYLSPRTLERFFDGRIPASKDAALIDIGVTISHLGQVVASKSYRGTGDWWPQYQQTAGYLLNKNDTPFAPLFWDYYEAVKKP